MCQKLVTQFFFLNWHMLKYGQIHIVNPPLEIALFKYRINWNEIYRIVAGAATLMCLSLSLFIGRIEYEWRDKNQLFIGFWSSKCVNT